VILVGSTKTNQQNKHKAIHMYACPCCSVCVYGLTTAASTLWHLVVYITLHRCINNTLESSNVPIPTIHPEGYRPVYINTHARRGALAGMHFLRSAPRRVGGRGARRDLYGCVVVDGRDGDIERLTKFT
jgi:hypothetical protein